MSRKLNLYEAKARLSSLVEDAADGETIIICKNGKPKAQLMPLSRLHKTGKRPLGAYRDAAWASTLADVVDKPTVTELLDAIEEPVDPAEDWRDVATPS